MANNRLYIVDTETGDSHMLAKGFGSGWSANLTDSLFAFLATHDITASETGATRLKLMTEDELHGLASHSREK